MENKIKVKQADIVKHWGIYHPEDGWLMDDSGVIVAFTCPRVANAQYDLSMQQGIIDGKTGNVIDASEFFVKEIK